MRASPVRIVPGVFDRARDARAIACNERGHRIDRQRAAAERQGPRQLQRTAVEQRDAFDVREVRQRVVVERHVGERERVVAGAAFDARKAREVAAGEGDAIVARAEVERSDDVAG
jgi:hypothetical protein